MVCASIIFFVDRGLCYAGTEEAVAEAIKKAGVPREEVWITTKLQYVVIHYALTCPFKRTFCLGLEAISTKALMSSNFSRTASRT